MKKQLDGVLEFLKIAEGLKNTLRSGYTSSGRQESVAEHTWRLCLLAITLQPNYPDLNFNRLFKMLIIHDLGEIINGDIPAIDQDPSTNKNEDEFEDFLQVIAPLSNELRSEFVSIWQEYDEAHSAEAKLAKALDKLETVLQHTQGENPQDFDYAFNLSYGKSRTDLDEITKYLRAQIDGWTEERIK